MVVISIVNLIDRNSFRKGEDLQLHARSYLAEFASLWFQWTFTTEQVIVFLFWFGLYLFGPETVFDMSWERLKQKLHTDIVGDLGNYKHWLPLAVMLIEYFINNIQFNW
jgi:hypothetical protein